MDKKRILIVKESEGVLQYGIIENKELVQKGVIRISKEENGNHDWFIPVEDEKDVKPADGKHFLDLKKLIKDNKINIFLIIGKANWWWDPFEGWIKIEFNWKRVVRTDNNTGYQELDKILEKEKVETKYFKPEEYSLFESYEKWNSADKYRERLIKDLLEIHRSHYTMKIFHQLTVFYNEKYCDNYKEKNKKTIEFIALLRFYNNGVNFLTHIHDTAKTNYIIAVARVLDIDVRTYSGEFKKSHKETADRFYKNNKKIIEEIKKARNESFAHSDAVNISKKSNIVFEEHENFIGNLFEFLEKEISESLLGTGLNLEQPIEGFIENTEKVIDDLIASLSSDERYKRIIKEVENEVEEF